MQASDLARKIRRIEIKSSKLVDEIFSGEYRSGFRGKGMEFENIRLYSPGDDVRSIDWNVTARQSRVYLKQFCEEREMNIFLLLDMSASNNFGSKKELIAELSATLAFAAIRNNDRVGAVFFTGAVERLIPSQKGKKHVLSIIESVLNFAPKRSDTDIAAVLRYFNQIEKKRSVVFLISDFLAEGYAKELKVSSGRHDLIRIRVVDRAEERLPAGAIFAFEDLETGETFVLDNLKRGLTIAPPTDALKRNLITVYTDEDYVRPLKKFFKGREAR